jgi:hypothetical protein
MDEIAELERRITAALVRIDLGVEALAQPSPAAFDSAESPVATLADGVAEAEIARLNEALDEERMLSAQLNERLRALRGREQSDLAMARGEIERLTRMLDVQGLEMQRLKQNVGALREQLRLTLEAQTEGRIDPQLINKSMLAELEALRALRAAESAELEEIIAALDPLAATAQTTSAQTEAHNA